MRSWAALITLSASSSFALELNDSVVVQREDKHRVLRATPDTRDHPGANFIE